MITNILCVSGCEIYCYGFPGFGWVGSRLTDIYCFELSGYDYVTSAVCEYDGGWPVPCESTKCIYAFFLI